MGQVGIYWFFCSWQSSRTATSGDGWGTAKPMRQEQADEAAYAQQKSPRPVPEESRVELERMNAAALQKKVDKKPAAHSAPFPGMYRHRPSAKTAASSPADRAACAIYLSRDV
jgi:hypothetical protein